MIQKLSPVFKDYLWGGSKLKTIYGKVTDLDRVAESWELSVHKDGLCRIEGGENDGITLADYIASHAQVLGRADKMSLMIKLIDAEDNLSVQVHPDDAYAALSRDSGKTEIWYILSAVPDARIYYGFCRDVTEREVRDLIERNEIESVLNSVTVHKGDAYEIPSGTVHAIGRGIMLAEVQQSSNLTYRLYDYDRTVNGKRRDLHIEQAMSVLNFQKQPLPDCSPTAKDVRTLCVNQYFSCTEYSVDGKRVIPAIDLYSALMVTEGQCSICGLSFIAGQSAFVDAGTEIEVEGSCVLLLAVPTIA